MDHPNTPPEDSQLQRQEIPQMAGTAISAGVPALVLAGAACKEAMKAASGADFKALVPVAGRPILSYVLDALSRARLVSQVAVIGGPELDPIRGSARRIEGTGSLLGNIKAGILGLGGRGRFLLCASDMPFLQPHMVDDFIEHALEINADLCYPIIPKAANEARFPNMKRTYVKLRDGVFTGGNLMLVNAEFMLRNEQIIVDAFNARKKPLKLAGLLGPSLIINLLLHRATIRQAEEAASRSFQGRLQALIVNHPEIGADVDRPEDIAPAESYLRAASEAG